MSSDNPLVVVLVRHGETAYNKEKRLQGPKDHLTEKGEEQMRAMQKVLDKYQFTRFLVSDEIRALQSAEILQSFIKKPFEKLPLLREKSSGDFSDYLVNEVDWSVVQGNFMDKKIPNGESVRDVMGRAYEFMKYLNTFEQGETALVISHGTFIRILLALIFNQSIEEYLLNYECLHASETAIYRTSNGKWNMQTASLRKK